MLDNQSCRLCSAKTKLFESHIIPAFVFRWMKQAGHLRHSQNVNKRVQDGAKEYWLCEQCESLFSSFETAFASNIFHPYDLNRALRVRYHEWLLKFCVSVSWRSLHYIRTQTASEFSAEQDARVEQALETWARYLGGEYKHVGSFEQHLIPFREVTPNDPSDFPSNINRYLTRTAEINATTTEGSCFVYTKFGPFALLGFIDVERPTRWKGSKIEKQGWFGQQTYVYPRGFLGYLQNRASRVQSINATMSRVQQDKVNSTVLRNMDQFVNSGLFRAMQRDVEIFGKAAFTKFDDPSE